MASKSPGAVALPAELERLRTPVRVQFIDVLHNMAQELDEMLDDVRLVGCLGPCENDDNNDDVDDENDGNDSDDET